MAMGNRQRNSRGYAKRKVGVRKIKQRFLIVCEGTKTEPQYFKGFRVPKVVVDIEGLGVNPSRLVDTARELREKMTTTKYGASLIEIPSLRMILIQPSKSYQIRIQSRLFK